MSETVKRITELQLCGSDSRAQSYNEGLKAAIHILESCEQPQLNENQQIVLEYLKKQFGRYDMSEKSIFDPINDFIQDLWNDFEKEAFWELTLKEEIQVLKIFANWALEQEED